MNIMRANLLLVLFLVAACGRLEAPALPDLAAEQPRVVAVSPGEGAQVASFNGVKVKFSHPVDPSSLHSESFVVVHTDVEDASAGDMLEAWKDRKTEAFGGIYSLSPDGLDGELALEADNLAAGLYAVIVTPAVRSISGVPMSQTPGEGATPFVSFFSAEEPSAAGVTGTTAIASVGGDTQATLVDATGKPSMGAPRITIVPDELMINEVYYDAPGSDTNGVLFVELRGTPDADVGGYVIHFVNGDGGTVTESVTIADGTAIPEDGLFVIADGMTGNLSATQVAEADIVDNFDPQNGPEAVQLISPGGKVVDVVGYGMPLPLYGESGLPMYEITPAPDAPSGQSISRRAGEPDTDNNAADFVVLATPTPGVE